MIHRSTEHPIEDDEQSATKRYLRKRNYSIPYLFISERKQQITRKTINYIINTAAKKVGLSEVHPHILKHSCEYLARV